MKKITKIFLSGSLVGIIMTLLLTSDYLNNVLVKILSFLIYPAVLVFRNIDTPLEWLCNFFHSDMCRGLGLDGGPLVWIEWLSLFITAGLWIGLIFVFIYISFKKFKKRES